MTEDFTLDEEEWVEGMDTGVVKLEERGGE